VCVCVCEGARAAGNSKMIANDELLWRWQISGGVTCVLRDSVGCLAYCTLSLAGCDFSGLVIAPWIRAVVTSGYLCFERLQCVVTYSQGSKHRIAQHHMGNNMFNMMQQMMHLSLLS